MSLGWAIFTFINLWWVSLFAVLSLGNSNDRAVGEHDYAAAPDAPNLKKKFLLTSLISALLTGLIAALMNTGIIRFV